ncbi:RRXRR domain-containing protein [Coleofasciculus sp. D1-CHI-01]|uniref:RRXRR domain-containing protein n=1 Tax=Coleofasciculus sp. D1-CHI-01 TaxID=3068482 RepID=UPI004063562A
MFVFVVDKNRKPLNPCHPARAREVLSDCVRCKGINSSLYINDRGFHSSPYQSRFSMTKF